MLWRWGRTEADLNWLASKAKKYLTDPATYRHGLEFLARPVDTVSALDSHIHTATKVDLRNLPFDDITNGDTDGLALFPEFYARTRQTIFHGILAHGFHYRGVGSLFVFGDNEMENWREGTFLDYREDVAEELIEDMNLRATFTSELDDVDHNVDDESIQCRIDTYAECSVISHFNVARVDHDDPEHVQAMEDYRNLGARTWNLMESLDASLGFDYMVTTAARYLPRAIAIEYARRNHKLITAMSDPLGDTARLLFTRMDGPDAHTISESAWKRIESGDLDESAEQALDRYMADRFDGVVQTQLSERGYMIDLDRGRDTFAMFTHVPWDNAIADIDRVFDDQYEWIIDTVREFDGAGDKQLVIKSHPGEVIAGTNERALEVVDREIESYPENVHVLDPSTKVNPYTLLEQSDVALVYQSTVGLEASYLGLPVISVGNAHYARKGFTYDPETVSGYHELLGASAARLAPDEAMRRNAEKYLHNYFISRPLEFTLVNPNFHLVRSYLSNLDSTAHLDVGGDEVLDAICRGAVDGSDVFYTGSYELGEGTGHRGGEGRRQVSSERPSAT